MDRCVHCGIALDGRQRQYCSDRCRMAFGRKAEQESEQISKANTDFVRVQDFVNGMHVGRVIYPGVGFRSMSLGEVYGVLRGSRSLADFKADDFLPA